MMVLLIIPACSAYVIYMRIVQWKLNEKDGIPGKIAFIPYRCALEDYRMADRESWFRLHAVCWTFILLFLTDFIAAVIRFSLIAYNLTESGISSAEISRRLSSGEAVAFIWEMRITAAAIMLFLIPALIARFHYAFGMAARFGMKGDWDFALGIVAFPWLFKASLAFSRNYEIEEHHPLPKKKKRKFERPHFF